MPESVEVYLLVQELSKHLIGAKILALHQDEKTRFKSKKWKLETWKALDRFPLTIASIWTHGKQIVFQFEEPGCYLVSHLGMSGQWLIRTSFKSKSSSPNKTPNETPNETLPEKYPARDKHANIWFWLEKDGSNFYLDFKGARHFGNLDFYTEEEEFGKRMKKYGPDVLQAALCKYDPDHSRIGSCPTMTYDLFVKAISGSRRKNQELAYFLLEQKYMAGVGNYIKAEVLYRAKLSPVRKLGELKKEEIETLYSVLLDYLYYNYVTQTTNLGSEGREKRLEMVNNYRNTWKKTGYDSLFLVFEQKKDPEGNRVVKETFTDKRTTHWVPTVQT